MDLHTTSGRPDWDLGDTSQLTRIQKVAASTGGVITPANAITTLGFTLVLYGLVAILDQQFLLGLVLLGIGRVLDIADGMIAQLTRTKSPLGEFYDAAIDKISTLLTIGVLFVSNITYWWLLVVLVMPQLIIPLVIYYQRRRGVRLHPTHAGKLSMAALWVSVAGLLVVAEMKDVWLLTLSVYGVLAASTMLGLYALWQYSVAQD